MTKAVLFDVDGVLIDSLNANFHFFVNLMNAAGYLPPTKEKYTTMFHLPMVDVIQQLTNASTEELLRIKELAENKLALYPTELVEMPADVTPTISLLAQNYALGLVTSRVEAGVYGIPQLAKLRNFFPVVITYENTVHHKPDPEPLLLAINTLQLSPAEVVYVGDMPTDFQAARSAGTKIIIYGNKEIKDADGYISRFAELPQLLSTWS